MTRQEKSTLPRVAAKAKGSFVNYVDKFLAFFNHLPALCCEGIPLLYDNLHTVDIFSTTYQPRLVNIG